VTPLTQKLLHWDELQNSILFCGAGVEVCAMSHLRSLGFVVVLIFILLLCNRLIWLPLSFECNLALLYFRIFTIIMLFLEL